MKYNEFKVDDLQESLLVKACPFCGNVDLEFSDKSTYYKLLDKIDTTCVSIKCRKCSTEQYLHHCEIGDRYSASMARLIKKWNRRLSNEI